MPRQSNFSILYTSGEVRAAIIDLFSRGTGRRVAIVGFVGDGAEAYLPRPRGIELVCWPKAGGTNPDSLRRLAGKGVEIRFANSLHMKVYWAEGQGSVVASANLSTNALGAGDLKELGVRLGAGRLNIKKVLASLKTRPMREKELRQLDRKHALWAARQQSQASRNSAESFSGWYESPCRREWKLLTWNEDARQSKAATELLRSQYAIRSASHWVTCARRSVCKGD